MRGICRRSSSLSREGSFNKTDRFLRTHVQLTTLDVIVFHEVFEWIFWPLVCAIFGIGVITLGIHACRLFMYERNTERVPIEGSL